MTCTDCRANLDDVPIYQPCPTCGSTRRDVTISAPPANAEAVPFGQGQDLNVSMAVDGLVSRPEVQKVVETKAVTLRFELPHEGAPEWVVQAWDGDRLIATAPAP